MVVPRSVLPIASRAPRIGLFSGAPHLTTRPVRKAHICSGRCDRDNPTLPNAMTTGNFCLILSVGIQSRCRRRPKLDRMSSHVQAARFEQPARGEVSCPLTKELKDEPTECVLAG